ncbi:MAG: transglutaminase-like domain-containing protein [Acidobacteriota bacterium]
MKLDALYRAALVLLCLAPLGAASFAQGPAVEGVDEVQALAPPAARISAYQNDGYRLWLEDGLVRVRVDNSHLGSDFPFQPPAREATEIGVLAGTLTAHAETVYEATSKVLGWVARNVRYDLDRQASQEAIDVLTRRSGYCTGIARLTVELLRAVGIEAREVAGYVVSSQPADAGQPGPRGYHRWIEVYYPDKGWAFSDPSTSHHFVPATYLRLASNELDLSRSTEGLLLSRREGLRARDVVAAAPRHVSSRRNDDRQTAAALHLSVEGAEGGRAELRGDHAHYTASLRRGSATFLGLRPGDYSLAVDLPGGRSLRRRLRLLKPIRADISMVAPLLPAPSDR